MEEYAKIRMCTFMTDRIALPEVWFARAENITGIYKVDYPLNQGFTE